MSKEKEMMTSGEIAKKAGVSPKAIRLYDEKGLLKPTGYSEGNYRLYDKEALLVLEKIIALKQVGYSLEEIHENLVSETEMDIKNSLQCQANMMEKKKYQLQKAIDCINNTLKRCNGKPDWDNVAEMIRHIHMDQRADEVHFEALAHNADSQDWYEKIYQSLELKAGERVADLGCGFGKLWRNNWDRLPNHITVTGVDIHGSWADHFYGYLSEKKKEGDKTADRFEILWSDLEEEDTWQQMIERAPYDKIIAHYLIGFLKDAQVMVSRAVSLLKSKGVLYINGFGGANQQIFWKTALEEMGLKTDFISNVILEKKKQEEDFLAFLKIDFSDIKKVQLTSRLGYDSAEGVINKFISYFPSAEKFAHEHQSCFQEYFERNKNDQGQFILTNVSIFWQAIKR